MLRSPAAALAALLVVLLPLAAACDDASQPAELIDRETFVETYVGLRIAALAQPEGELPEARRDSVLEAHGVTGEELLAFAEAHGDDVATMNEIWAEVQARLDSIPPADDP